MRNILITFLLVFISGLAGYPPLFAQNQPVSRIHEVSRIHGQVQDRSGKAVSGANVFIKGTVEGTSSDENGHFSFETSIQGDTVLLVRHISMEDLEIGIVISESMPALALRMYDKTNLVGEVVVVADQGLVLLDGSRATTLRTMDVETTAGGDGDVVGALQTLPGVQQIGNNGALFVRGGSSEEAKTLIDGLEITHPYYSGIPDLAQKSRFSPHLFEGITFNTGGYSALYGDALSSVLALTSRDHPSNTSTVLAMMLYGLKVGHDYVNPQRRTSFGLDLGYSDFGPYFKWIGHRTNWLDAPINKTANANFRQNIGDHGMLKWYGYGNLSDQKALVPDYAWEAGGTVLTESPLRVKNNNLVSLLTYTHRLNEHWRMYAGYGYNTNSDLTANPSLQTDTREQQHQLRLNLYGKTTERTAINMGSEVYFNSWDQQSETNYGIELFRRSLLKNNRWDTWVDFSYRPIRNLIAQVGLRTAWNEALVEDFLLMPRLNLTYHAAQNSFSASAGKYAQQPSSRYLYQAGNPQSSVVNPWADFGKLEHAEVTHYLLNFQRKNFGRTLRVEAYYKDYKDLVQTTPQLVSGGSGFARGLDFFWRDQVAAKGLDYWISYSWLDTERQYLDYPVQTRPTFAAPHTLHLVAKQFVEPLGIFVGGSYSMATGRPYYNPSAPAFLSDRMPTFHQINLNFAFLRKWGNTFNTFVFAVNNLTGRQQIFDYRFSPDGNIRTKVELPYKRGFLVGWFISIGKDRSDEILNQLP